MVKWSGVYDAILYIGPVRFEFQSFRSFVQFQFIKPDYLLRRNPNATLFFGTPTGTAGNLDADRCHYNALAYRFRRLSPVIRVAPYSDHDNIEKESHPKHIADYVLRVGARTPAWQADARSNAPNAPKNGALSHFRPTRLSTAWNRWTSWKSKQKDAPAFQATCWAKDSENPHACDFSGSIDHLRR
jgi:hypothetical protein